jgi:hypothetical protein
MKQLISALGDAIVGVANGFDRIVFQGMIRPLMYSEGAMGFFQRRRIRFKDAKRWVTDQTDRLITAVEEWSVRECGEPIAYLPSATLRKEAIARKRQQEKGITTGLVGTWSCLEGGGTYRLQRAEGAPRLKYFQGRCKHLYIYLDHPEYGFMSIRIQTWLPYKIQIAMNGREWLARQLQRDGIGFERLGNKILHVDDFAAMQSLLDQQLTTKWWALLNEFVPIAFPTMASTVGTDLSYTWNVWQSEWASDLVFQDRRDLEPMMHATMRHAFIQGHPQRLLRYFGHPTKKDGQPRRDFASSLKTTLIDLEEGLRIRHWLGSNSVKMYNEVNVLRIESTINDPRAFRVHRRKQGADKDAPTQLLLLRKGVADMTRRARISQGINDRFADHLATTRSALPLHSILESVTQRTRRRGRSVRGLDPTGKDLHFLKAVADPRFLVGGFGNKDLRHLLATTDRYLAKSDTQQSGMTTRSLRLLRDHGLIRRLPNARRYQLTATGRQLVTCLQAALAASTDYLAAMAA